MEEIDLSAPYTIEPTQQYCNHIETTTYLNKLYPEAALELLAQSRSHKWTGGPIDNILKSLVLNWYSKKLDKKQYMTQLFEAITKTNMLQSVLLRLNFDALSAVKLDTITIRSIHQTLTKIAETTKHQPLPPAIKEKIKTLLSHHLNKDINNICDNLMNITKNSNLEQTLIGWVGYIITMEMIKTETISLDNNQLAITWHQT